MEYREIIPVDSVGSAELLAERNYLLSRVASLEAEVSLSRQMACIQPLGAAAAGSRPMPSIER